MCAVEATFADDVATVLLSAPDDAGSQASLLSGAHALWTGGDRLASRRWFDAAYRLAESEGDAEAMAWSALGMGGLWLHEHRDTAAAVLVDARLRSALAAVDPRSSLGLRLRARLAGETDYRAGEHAAILTAVREARRAEDAIACAEAASMAHQCLLGPEHFTARRILARELIAESFRTTRRCDLLVGLLWRVADLFLEADPHAERHLADLKGRLAQHRHLAVEYVVRAVDVMLDIRAGRLEQAEASAAACAEQGTVAGDPNTLGWLGLQMLAIRWYQGRVGELLPTLNELVNSPTLSAVDDSHLAALAMATAATGDHRQAAAALAKLRGVDLARLPRSSTWLVTMYGIVETANLLDDAATSLVAYDLLRPFAHLPIMAGVGVTCFGSVQHALGVAALTNGDAAQAVEHLRVAVRHNLALGNSPAATLSRARLAQALRSRGSRADDGEAQRELDCAAEKARQLGMALPSYAVRPAAWGKRRLAVCRRYANRWEIELGDRSALVDDSLGVQYLAILIANPGCEITAVQLAAGPGLISAAAAASAASSQQPILDAVAEREYRRRLTTLQAEIDAYHTNGDADGAAQAQKELDWLVNELRTASGLGGRVRTFANSGELARISVGKAIRRALNRIATADPVIGSALRETVSTGLRCCYRPDLAS